jgi:DNA-directed RNA polymerase specialized sigma subunit
MNFPGGERVTEEITKELDRRKRYLKKYKRNNVMIKRLSDRLDALNMRIYSIKSPSMSDMPRGGEPVDLVDLLADKADLEERIRRLKSRGDGYRTDLINIIDELDDPRYADVLEAFFVDGKTFEDIADELGYTTRHVIRLYSEGILAMSL